MAEKKKQPEVTRSTPSGTTPEEREHLDKLRREMKADIEQAKREGMKTETTPPPPDYYYVFATDSRMGRLGMTPPRRRNPFLKLWWRFTRWRINRWPDPKFNRKIAAHAEKQRHKLAKDQYR